MARIRVLNDRLINKIAAGEVVERPASALKELLENALDAGASELQIDLEAGGKRLIRVVDDGHGMDPDDLLLALERHATSKIIDFDDLDGVVTLGFRGEAIPSIAAVSRMTLRSRQADMPDGREAVIEGGVIRNVQPVPMAHGTSVEVRGLFYNVPARKKFLRTTQTELAHCQNVVSHYALGFPETLVKLRHNGRELLTATPAESVRERISMILGAHMLDKLLPFEGSDGDYSIMGFISEPSFTRTDTSMLNFFVNRRAVRDKLMIHAVRSAFEDLLPKGRTPIAFLFVTLPPKEVDVNVHPSKTEVRFNFSERVHSLIRRSIRSALSGSQPLTSMAPSEQRRRKIYRLERRADDENGDERKNPETDSSGVERALRISFSQGRESFLNPPLPHSRHGAEGRQDRAAADDDKPQIERFAKPSVEERVARPTAVAMRELDGETVLPLGQVKNSYIVATWPGGLLLIDQHAAHERILFEQLQRAAAGKPEEQLLLHPVSVNLTPSRTRLVDEHRNHLKELGFEAELGGPSSVVLRSLPSALEVDRAEEIFQHMAADLERTGKPASRDKLIKELVVSASCHGAIKVNTPLNTQKMRWLLDSLFACEMPMRCPHGRPVVLTIGEAELRQRFGRS